MFTPFNNCFLLVGLDPHIMDDKVIQAAIFRKQKQWSREQVSVHPERKRIAQQCLQNLSTIKKRLLSPDLRSDEAHKAKRLIAIAREAQREAFENAVYLLSQGQILDQTVRQVANRFKTAFFTEHDVRELLHSYDAKRLQRRQKQSGKSRTRRLHPSLIKLIQKNLKMLNQTSLYGFLQVAPNVPLSAIHPKMMQLKKTLLKAAITPENDIKRELLSHCQTVFKDESRRKAYNLVLADAQLTPLIEQIEQCCQSGQIEIGHVLFLLRQIEKYQIQPAELLRMIHQKAERRQVPVKVAHGLRFDTQIQCICGNMNHPYLRECGRCAESLYIPCGDCDKSAPVDHLECGCGYSLSQAFSTLNVALNSGQIDIFVELWDQKRYGRHPRFRKLAESYSHLRKKVIQKKNAQKRLIQQLKQLNKAFESGENSAIIQAWSETLLKDHPQVLPHYPKIRQAFQPPEVQSVDAVHQGSYIQVQWQMMSFVKKYRVVWSANAYPKNLRDGDSIEISKAAFEANGFRIENPRRQHYFIKVYAINTFLGENLLSVGEALSCKTMVLFKRKTTIYYTMRFRGLLKKNQVLISFTADKNVTKLPKVVVIAKYGTILPVHAQQGENIGALNRISLKQNVATAFRIPLKDLPSPTRFRLFMANPDDEAHFELRPISSPKLRI